jgi:hypothetical protein
MSEVFYYVIAVLIIVALTIAGVFGFRAVRNAVFNGNKQVIDTNLGFDKCITYLGNEKIEIDIDKWNDYEGEQIQVVDKNGNVYLLSSFNTMLVKENKNE